MSTREKKRATRHFTQTISCILGVNCEIPAPDVNTDAQTIGGSFGREAATGRGVVYCLEEVPVPSASISRPATFAMKGFGNVGSWFARLVGELGCRVVAVSDARAAPTTRVVSVARGGRRRRAGRQLVVPDILANAGGVAVSCFEWVQNIQRFRWEEDHVNAELKKTMAHGLDERP